MREVEKKLKKKEARKEKKKNASLAIKTSKITGRVPSMKKLKKMVVRTTGGKPVLEKLKKTRAEKKIKNSRVTRGQKKPEATQVETEKVAEVKMEVDEDNKA